jgi:transposase
MLATWPKRNRGKFPMNSGRTSSHWFQSRRHAERASVTSGVPVAGASRWEIGKFSPALFTCCEPAANGRRCPSRSAAPVPFTNTFNVGADRDSSWPCGRRGWPSMTIWKELPGSGKALMGLKAKRRWRRKRWATTPRIGEKKGSKRSLLVDGAGVPLSLIVSGANRHDVKLLAITLDSIVVVRPKTSRRRRQNLCADKGYAGHPAAQAMKRRGYTPHVRQRGEESRACRKGQRARRWVVERTHSWFAAGAL